MLRRRLHLGQIAAEQALGPGALLAEHQAGLCEVERRRDSDDLDLAQGRRLGRLMRREG